MGVMEWNQVLHGSCLDILPLVSSGSVELVATDPPFNIGLKYDLYEDKKGYNEYQDWCRKWIAECVRILAPNGSIYVCIGDEYAAEVNIIMKQAGLIQRNWCLWYYTFGENQRKKFNRCHTHILYFSKSSTDLIWNGDSVKVPSARQLKYNDKRAKAGGKIPDDVWQISRVCGTFKERIKRADGSAHPCQMPESIMERMILASSNVASTVVDPFCGTGTTAAVAKRLGRRYLTMDVSDEYCSVARERLAAVALGLQE